MAAPQDAEQGYYSRAEYCATCHYRYDTEIEKHAKHKKESVTCDDCHSTTTTAGGTRYSVHDHRFDFSQPEIACAECHEPGDERLGKTPTHVWNIGRVSSGKALTVEQACARCHEEKGLAWVQEKLKTLKRRL